MKYHLRFSINYDADHWNRETYQEDTRRFYTYLIKSMKVRDAKIEDWYIEFRNGTPEFAAALSQRCRAKDYNFDLWVFLRYSRAEIRTARFVPLCCSGVHVDEDEQGYKLNTYKEVLCEYCGRTNDRNMPTPYFIYYKRVRKPRDIFVGWNGIYILSVLAFTLLQDEIKPWVDYGPVQAVDKNRKPVESDYEYIWIRPKIEVGPFVNASIKQVCNKCGQPTEIRVDYSGDIFEVSKETVESFKNTEAPIVISGNWFGEINNKKTSNLLRYVFISPDLHERMRKLKFKGFVKADRVIHAADEPYEWDPLRYKHSSTFSRD